MCSHYEAVKDPSRLKRYFGTLPPAACRTDVWPTYPAVFVVRSSEEGLQGDAIPEVVAHAGLFGLVPHWAKDITYGRRTYNARSETASQKPSFRDSWRRGRRCIIPAEAFYEPNWQSGRAVATRISRLDGLPMGIAGLWSSWEGSNGNVLSFAMLTVNADGHTLMRSFHRPDDEKRMVVILPMGAYRDWLEAPVDQTMEFMQQYPADRLTVLNTA